ncbi:site-specific DNA-methyltransferase, partial [Candidatus Woesearchaeota archaeon]|nr:site-specific DNA-methyltransferase [Candidatus Woesearchaeota archaeon]
LLYRIILSSSNINDIVLDPFMGSGTTGAIAKKLRRRYIGIEKDSSYKKIAEDRIKKIIPIDEELLSYKIEKPKPKVAFGNLIKKDFIKVGEILTDKYGNNKARVFADGTINLDGEIGSIHSISAKILNKLSNNGWDFWFVIRDGILKSINDLRYKYAKNFMDY